jgi:hypothetical protein
MQHTLAALYCNVYFIFYLFLVGVGVVLLKKSLIWRSLKCCQKMLKYAGIIISDVCHRKIRNF